MNEEDDFEGIDPVVKALHDSFMSLSQQVIEQQEGSKAVIANLMALNLAVTALVRLTPNAEAAIRDLAAANFTGAPDDPVHRAAHESLEQDLHIRF